MRILAPIERPGIYRARNGKLLTITQMSHRADNAAVGDLRAGFITGTQQCFTWHRGGRCLDVPGLALDTVEFVKPADEMPEGKMP